MVDDVSSLLNYSSIVAVSSRNKEMTVVFHTQPASLLPRTGPGFFPFTISVTLGSTSGLVGESRLCPLSASCLSAQCKLLGQEGQSIIALRELTVERGRLAYKQTLHIVRQPCEHGNRDNEQSWV